MLALMRRGTARRTASSVIRVAGPETESARRDGVRGTATATHRTPSSCSPFVGGVAVLGRPLETSGELLWVGDRVDGVTRHTGPLQELLYMIGIHVGQEGLSYRGAVGEDSPTHLGEHPHGVPGRDLGHVDDLVPVEHREVGGLTQLVHETSQMRFGPEAEHS